MRIATWNVNGLRSVQTKGWQEFIENYKPDVLCVQETKCQDEQVEALALENCVSCSAEKKGYSGVATLVFGELAGSLQAKAFGIEVVDFDREGRFLISGHSEFSVYNIYFPSGTTGELRQQYKYEFLDALYEHLKSLTPKERGKLIICGDFNICHRPIDIHHPEIAEKKQMTGFLPEERKWMDRFCALGFVDCFRHVHGDVPGKYTWWSFRAGSRSKNLGWRIDYIFVGKELAGKVRSAEILSDVKGSDHCPVVVDIEL